MSLKAPQRRLPSVGAAPTVDWLQELGPGASGSRFIGKSGVGEWHITVVPNASGEDPVRGLEDAWLAALDAAGINPESTVLRRVCCRDVATQSATLESFGRAYPGAFSVIGQPPLGDQPPHGGADMALWSYHITDPAGPLDLRVGEGGHGLQRGPLRHYWTMGMTVAGDTNAATQCQSVLDRYSAWLSGHGMNLADHVVRTWWHLRDIDDEYAELVDVRREFFREHDLTEHTHYIASTGIAGVPAEPAARLSFDAHAIHGLVEGQVEYLNAPDHLGSTHDYGVTFERATKIAYADRCQVYLSGTASIDVAGEIVHPGDVIRQLDRALENSAALLAAAGMDFGDLAMMLVYLRDPADGPEIERICRARFPRLPMLVLHAPVCRPGWLVEVEGIALLADRDNDFPEF